MARRAAGEGSIWKNKDGTWRGAVSLGTDPSGKHRRKFFRGPNQSEIRKKIDKAKKDQEAGRKVAIGPMSTVADWLTAWLLIIERTRKPSTFKTYRTHVKYAIAAFGSVRFDKLTTEMVEALYVALEARGLESVTVAGVHRTLRSAFNKAVKRGHLSYNVVAHAEPPRVIEREVIPLTIDEAKAVMIAATGRRNGARWQLALLKGWRQGEGLGFQWDDFDLEKGTGRVRRALTRAPWKHGCGDREPCGKKAHRCPWRYGGGLIVDEPKSEKAKRTFKLTPEEVVVLKAHRAAQAAERLAAGELWLAPPTGGLNSGSGWVFATPFGGPVDPKRDWADWKDLLKLAKVRDRRVHAARHTTATFLLVLGVDPRTVMDLMAWSHPSLLSRYQHVVDELKAEAARRMGELLPFEDTGS